MSGDTYVQLFFQATDGAGNYGSGNYEILAAGNLQESAAIGLVTPIVLGQLDTQGSFSQLGIMSPVNLQSSTVAPNSGIPLLSSDSFGQTNGQWNLLYNIKLVVAGMQDIIASNVPVLFANGSSQSLFTVLQAAGWTPPISPTEVSP